MLVLPAAPVPPVVGAPPVFAGAELPPLLVAEVPPELLVPVPPVVNAPLAPAIAELPALLDAEVPPVFAVMIPPAPPVPVAGAAPLQPALHAPHRHQRTAVAENRRSEVMTCHFLYWQWFSMRRQARGLCQPHCIACGTPTCRTR